MILGKQTALEPAELVQEAFIWISFLQCLVLSLHLPSVFPTPAMTSPPVLALLPLLSLFYLFL